VGQDFILQPVFNRLLAAEQRASKSADEIGAQLAKLPHSQTWISGVFLELGQATP
jgi:hypothetical protein